MVTVVIRLQFTDLLCIKMLVFILLTENIASVIYIGCAGAACMLFIVLIVVGIVVVRRKHCGKHIFIISEVSSEMFNL